GANGERATRRTPPTVWSLPDRCRVRLTLERVGLLRAGVVDHGVPLGAVALEEAGAVAGRGAALVVRRDRVGDRAGEALHVPADLRCRLLHGFGGDGLGAAALDDLLQHLDEHVG